jgi:hypothetical protein
VTAPQASPLTSRVPYHIGLGTRDLEKAQRSLSAVFGVEWTPIRLSAGDLPMNGALAGPTRIVHSLGGPLRFEVIEGTPGSVYETEAIATLHHYAYWSTDVAADVGSLVEDGWTVEMAVVDAQQTPTLMAYLVNPDLPRIEVTSEQLRPEYESAVGLSQGPADAR